MTFDAFASRRSSGHPVANRRRAPRIKYSVRVERRRRYPLRRSRPSRETKRRAEPRDCLVHGGNRADNPVTGYGRHVAKGVSGAGRTAGFPLNFQSRRPRLKM